MDKKILLINAKGVAKKNKSNTSLFVPIGILSIASYINTQQDYEAQVFDLCLNTEEELFQQIEKEKPSLLGISCTTPTYKGALETAKKLKEKFPSLPIVFGGIHPTLKQNEVIGNDCVDYVIVGEGEYAIKELLSAITDEKKLSEVQGLLFKKNNDIIFNGRAAWITDLTELPFPDYNLINLKPYIDASERDLGFRSLEIIVSRGCPFQCSFCAVHSVLGQRWRSYPSKIVVKEIQKIIKKYSLEGVWFKDSTFTVNKKWVQEFCDELENRNINIKWSCNSRIDTIDEELIQRMKAVGLQKLWFGVESGSEKILKKLKKNAPKEKVVETFKLCKKYGIKSAAFFMIGLPTETMEDIKQTVDFADIIEADVLHWHIFNPFPGCELHDEMLSAGMIQDGDYDRMAFHKAGASKNTLSIKTIEEVFEKICNYFYNAGPRPF